MNVTLGLETLHKQETDRVLVDCEAGKFSIHVEDGELCVIGLTASREFVSRPQAANHLKLSERKI